MRTIFCCCCCCTQNNKVCVLHPSTVLWFFHSCNLHCQAVPTITSTPHRLLIVLFCFVFMYLEQIAVCRTLSVVAVCFVLPCNVHAIHPACLPAGYVLKIQDTSSYQLTALPILCRAGGRSLLHHPAAIPVAHGSSPQPSPQVPGLGPCASTRGLQYALTTHYTIWCISASRCLFVAAYHCSGWCLHIDTCHTTL